MKKRVDYLDTSKGIAILAVVVSHAISNANGGLNVDHLILLNWLSFFNVSTFFFINGFLYNESCVGSPIKAIIKKIKAYYIPYISFNMFFLVINNILVKAHIIDASYYIADFRTFLIAFVKLLFGKIQSLTGPMWFLRALILVSVMYILVDCVSSRILNGKYRYIFNGIAALLVTLIGELTFIPTTFNFPSACHAFVIYYLGVVYHKFEANNYVKRYIAPISIISTIISVTIGFTFMVGIQRSISMPISYIAALSSIIMVLSISQLRSISKIKTLKYLGTCSLEIMALHFLAFKPISFLLIRFYNLEINTLTDIPVVRRSNLSALWYVLYSICGTTLPAAYYFTKKAIGKRIHQ